MTDDPHRDDPPNHVGKKAGGSGSDVGWTVEARLAYIAPSMVAGNLLDDRWRTLHFHEAKAGVPRAPRYRAPWFEWCGLYDYAAAQALRWWFHAEAQAKNDGICLETRLVRHKMSYTYEHTAETVHAVIGGEDRSSVMPDWGKKNEPAT